MATLTIPDEKRDLTEALAIQEYLSTIGIAYERWQPSHDIAPNAPAADILAAYANEIEKLKAEGGYVTADVIDVHSQTPGLEAMLAKFKSEHWHDEDEVRFIIEGRGVFHIHPQDSPVVAIEVEAGDLLRVPRGTLHWFNLCADQRIRAIRLFQDPAGWTPNYTDSGAEARYQPLCLGTAYVAIQP
ncbi:MAG: cupin domain-containing protein [Acidobacteria bacterium]|nr:cupin domain-containing protein [Acidobacteriota bacterium]